MKNRIRNREFGREEVRIGQGEHFATGEDVVVSTLLGSCVSVVLIDRISRLAGMNHFLLPQPTFSSSEFLEKPSLPLHHGSLVYSEYGRYGVHAMELLINDLLRLGALKGRLEAKVFGGSRILALENESLLSVSDRNVEFAFGFLMNEGIPVSSHSVGGSSPRRIYLLPSLSRVYVRLGGYTQGASHDVHQ